MNCWEALYFAAYKAGVLTMQQLQTEYNGGGGGSKASLLGYDNAQVVTSPGTLQPNPGEVLLSDTVQLERKHVVLCVGDQDGTTMSLWTFETGGTFDMAPLTIVTSAPEREPLRAVKKANPF